MSFLIEISVASILIGYNTFEFVRIGIFKIDKNGLILGLTSMIAIAFGLYLCLKNGIVLDYGTAFEISESWAEFMWNLGLICLCLGFAFIVRSILKYVLWKLKQ